VRPVFRRISLRMRTLASSFHFAPPVDVVRCALTKGFLSGAVGLPVLPEIAGRVIALANDLNTEIEDLCRLIEQDQTLAANILRYANSATFAGGARVESLHEAMMRMGMTMVSSIAVAACLEGKEFQSPAYDAYRREVREHALLTSGLARELARRQRCNVEMVFMCALMHTIGQPVVLRLLVDLQREHHVVVGEIDAAMLAREYELAAATSAVKAWDLPYHVQLAAIHYRQPAAAPEFVREITIVALASRLAHGALGDTPEPAEPMETWPEWQALNLEPEEFEELAGLAHMMRGGPVE